MKLRAVGSRERLNSFGVAAIFVVAAIGAVAIAIAEPSVYVYKAACLALCVCCVLAGLREKFILNPYYLFFLTPLSLLLYEPSISTFYMLELDASTYFVALSNMLAFLVGLSLVKWKPKSFVSASWVGEANLTHVALVTLIVGLVPTIYSIAIAPNVLLSGKLLEMGDYLDRMPLASVLIFFKYIALACALKSRKRPLIAIVVIGCLFALALNFNKTQLLFFVIVLMVSLFKYYTTVFRSHRGLTIAIALLVVLLFIYAIGFYDDVRSDWSTTEVLLKRSNWNFSNALLLPYMYFCQSWTNLQYVMTTQPDHTWGLWALRPLLTYTGLTSQFGDAYSLSPYFSGFNVYTFVTVQWKDFGTLGSWAISLLLGFMISKIYAVFRETDSPFAVAIYALNGMAVLEMFFNNHFFRVVYPFTIIAISYLCCVLMLAFSKKMRLARRATRPRREPQPAPLRFVDHEEGYEEDYDEPYEESYDEQDVFFEDEIWHETEMNKDEPAD